MLKANRTPLIASQEMVIRAHNLTVRVGDDKLLDNVALTVNPGEYVAITGPSGSGKTTLANYLLGLSIGNQPPAEGRVYYGGTSIYSLASRDRAALRGRLFGYAPQTPNLIPDMTVQDNITVSARMRGLPIDPRNLGKLVGIAGIGAKLNQKAGTLSGGEQQRAAIVRAFAPQPAAVILDEPTAALNASLKHEINGLLSEISDHGDTTLIVISHEETTAHREISLNSGLVVGDTPSQTLVPRGIS